MYLDLSRARAQVSLRAEKTRATVAFTARLDGMKKTNHDGKQLLLLKKETIRELTAEELAAANVAGGSTFACTWVSLISASVVYTIIRGG
jgi:hypothetical protein